MESITKNGIEYRVYDNLYAVSRCGKALRAMVEVMPGKHSGGYLTLGRRRLMHRVVALCWIPTDDTSKHVHHINGDKTDNRADNLAWLSPLEHIGDHHTTTPYTRTEEACAKFRDNRLGKKDSPETILKKRVGFDMHRSGRPCMFNGVRYECLSDGARVSGLSKRTFRSRCISRHSTNYELL